MLGSNVTEDKCQLDFGHSNSLTPVSSQLLLCESLHLEGHSHNVPAPRKAQTPPHYCSRLGFGVWSGLYLTSQCCFVIKTLLVVHGSFLFHFLWHTQAATHCLKLHLWLPLCRWQVVSQQQKLGHSCSSRSSICHAHSCPPQPAEPKAKHAGNEVAFGEQRNQPGRYQG